MYTENDFRLYHHGIQGQKWGVQNGPPYPLDSSVSTGHRLKSAVGKIQAHHQKARANRIAKKEAKLEKKKKEAIRKGTPEALKKYQNSLTREEFAEAVEWARLKQSMSNYQPKDTPALEKASKTLKDVTNFASDGIRAWNIVANVINSSQTDVQVPVIDGHWAADQVKKQKEEAANARKEKEQAYIRRASSEDILKNASSLSTDSLKERSLRDTYLNNIGKNVASSQEAPKPGPESTRSAQPKTEQKSAQNTERERNTWTRDNSNPYWDAAYRKVVNSPITQDIVREGASRLAGYLTSSTSNQLLLEDKHSSTSNQLLLEDKHR